MVEIEEQLGIVCQVYFNFLCLFLYFSASVIDNSRIGTKRFTVPLDSVMHGIAGYFDAVLYGDVTLSKYKLFYF